MELADALQLTAGVAASLASGGLLPPPPERPSLRRLDALRRILNAVAAAAEKSLRVRPRGASGSGPGRCERAEGGSLGGIVGWIPWSLAPLEGSRPTPDGVPPRPLPYLQPAVRCHTYSPLHAAITTARCTVQREPRGRSALAFTRLRTGIGRTASARLCQAPGKGEREREKGPSP